MTILISGMKCRICGEPVVDGQEVRMFPPFVGNELDPLFVFNDAAFHASCFEQHPLANLAIDRLRLIQVASAPERRRCYISGRQLTNPDEFLGVGYLTSNTDDPLYDLNLAQFDRHELACWPRLEWFIRNLRRLKGEGAWKGPSLEWLINHLEGIYRESKRSTSSKVSVKERSSGED